MRSRQSLTAESVRERVFPAGDWRVEGPILRGRSSVLFKAVGGEAPWPLAVKVYDASVREALVTKQSRLLDRMHAAMGSAQGLTVPKPWAALPAHRTLIMEWIFEPQVSRLLSLAGRDRARRANCFAVAGRWLAHFHSRSKPMEAALDVHALRLLVDETLGGSSGAVSDAEFRACYKALERHASEFSGLPVAHARPHGDFNPNNLLHGPERTVGIDFGLTPPSPVTYDISRFLVQAETSRPYVASWAEFGPFGMPQRDWDAFMQAYGPLKPALDERQVAYLHLVEAMRRWATFFGRRPSGTFDLTRQVKRRRLHRMASGAMRLLAAPRTES